MQQFNLTFSGEILPGKAPAAVKARFGKLLGITDPNRIEQFFSGKEVILRRNLTPAQAAEFYARLRGLGALPALAKVVPEATSAGEGQARAADSLPDKVAAKPVANNSRWAPNPYTLRPFHDRQAPRRREIEAKRLCRLGMITAAATALALLLLGVRQVTLSAPAPAPQLAAGTSHTGGELLLATDQLLLRHDRSGTERDVTSLQEMGLSGAILALAYSAPDEILILLAKPSAAGALYRCTLSSRQCLPVFDESGTTAATAFALVAASGNLIMADPANKLLTLHSPDGELLASAERELPSLPILRVEEGLLLVNGSNAPSISVLRYEPEAFAEQLDEILLLPTEAVSAGLSRTRDFNWAGDHWWVSMENPDTGATGLFRFDDRWNPVAVAPLPGDHQPRQLLGWNERLLVLDPRHTQLLRFSAKGQAEAPLLSNHLQTLVTEHSEEQARLAAQSHLLLAGLVSILLLALGFAGWQRLRLHTSQGIHYRNAPLLGRYATDIQWLPAAENTGLRLRHILLKLRILPDHIGMLAQQIILVDHRGTYHIGAGRQLCRHPLFLIIDDVVIYTGPSALREFDDDAWPLLASALAEARPADTAMVLAALAASRHPLAIAGSTLLVLAVAGILALAV